MTTRKIVAFSILQLLVSVAQTESILVALYTVLYISRRTYPSDNILRSLYSVFVNVFIAQAVGVGKVCWVPLLFSLPQLTLA